MGPTFNVIGFDVKKERVEELKKGIDRTKEVSADDLKKAKIDFTSDPKKMKDANFIIVAVPTPIHEDTKIPDLKFPAKVEMPSHAFNEAMDDMNIITESVMLSAAQNLFMIKSEGKLNSARVEFNNDDNISITIDKAENIASKYSIEYMNKIAKGSKLADSVSLYFGNEYPLKAEFKVVDKLSLSVILAPRVMND